MISSVKYMPEYVILVLTGSTVNCSVFSRARPNHPKSKPVRPEEWALLQVRGSGGFTPGPGGTDPSKSWPAPKFSRPQILASHPNLAVLLAYCGCGQLILKKISKFDATRCQILRLKCTKFGTRWGFAPDPAGGA